VLGRSLRVVVRVRPGVRSFRATVSSGSGASGVVSDRFRRTANGSERVATLRVGKVKGFGFGNDALLIRTTGARGHRWFSQASFVMARAARGLFTAVTAVPTAAGARIRVDLPDPSFNLRVTVDADDGLRPGANTIVLRALDAILGNYQVRRLRVRMPSDIPVAGAGSSRRTQVRRTVTLSAANSVAAAGQGRLQYRWVIVQAPRGSRTRLRDAAGVRPRLRPDRPGRYRLRLIVTQRRRAPAFTAGRPHGRPLRVAGGGSSATTAVLATVPTAPTGVPVDTIVPSPTQGPERGVEVGGQFYIERPPFGLQLLVFDRSTLALVDDEGFYDSPDGGYSTQELEAKVKSLPNTDLVIITKPNAQAIQGQSPSSEATADINGALASIGVPSISETVATGGQACGVPGVPCSTFSAIGVPGLPAGEGTVNAGLASLAGSGLQPGDLHGYLQQDLTGTNYTFVDADRVPFDTGDPSANPPVITVGSSEPGSPYPVHTYAATGVPASDSGFDVLVLDAGSLDEITQGTFLMDGTGGGPAEMTMMGQLLLQYADDPAALVIVRTINAPHFDSGQAAIGDELYGYMVNNLANYGVSGYLLEALNLDGTSVQSSEYAQVSPADPGTGSGLSPWAQVASNVSTGSGRLTGLLARNTSGQWYPNESINEASLNDPSRPLAGSMAGIISLPTSPWPDRNTAADQAVLTCIANNITKGGLQLPIESNYTNQNLKDNWAAWAATISDSGYSGVLAKDPGCGSLDPGAFTAVTQQLNDEFTDVTAVWRLIDNLQAALIGSQGTAFGIQSVANEVTSDVDTQSSVSYNPAYLAGDLLFTVASAPGIDESVAGAASLLAQLIGDGADVSDNPDGSSAIDTTVNLKASDFAQDLEDRYTTLVQNLSHEGDILVSDWTKLNDAYQNSKTGGAANWTFSTNDFTKADNLLQLATRQQSFETLFPAAYSLYRLQAGDAAGSVDPQDATTYQCGELVRQSISRGITKVVVNLWQPFTSLNQYGSTSVTNPYADNTQDGLEQLVTPEQWVYAGPDDSFLANTDNRSAVLPGQSLLSDLFVNPPPESAAGSTQPLFNPLQFDVEAYDNATQNSTTVTHQTLTDSGASTNLICESSASQATSASSPRSVGRGNPRPG
jgi:hypothetical protein